MSCHLSVIPWESYDRTWCSHQNPSFAGSQSTPLSSERIADPCSLDDHRPWSSRSPPCRTGTCSDERTCQHSRCWSHRSDPGSSCPRRRWSENTTIDVKAILIVLTNTTYKYLFKLQHKNGLLLCPFWCSVLSLIAVVLCPAKVCHFYTHHDR